MVIAYTRPWAFRFGVLASTVGVLLHLPMYGHTADMGYVMTGMEPDPPMIAGMFLILIGLAGAVYGLIPRGAPDRSSRDVRIRAMENAPLRPAHVGLITVTSLAIVIDMMKPISLAFVAPGMTAEYGLQVGEVALLPVFGLSGTVIGSFTWGWLGDHIGRRASILLAGLMFAATGVCGTMPSFLWNLVMCFLMGLAAGGMLPIAFALMAETIPTRHRGWLMVVTGGGTVALAYIITSSLSAALVPEFGWRILWLIGIPTGLLLILLNRWFPESPRFLLIQRRDDEARGIMMRFGATFTAVEHVGDGRAGGYRRLFERPFTGVTAAILLLGIATGLVTFGFQLWIPSNLQRLGFPQDTADLILGRSAITGLPFVLAAAALYRWWSAKKTIILLGGLVAIALVIFSVTGAAVGTWLLYPLLALPICGAAALTALLSAYSAEIYPTRVRARGSGLSAGAAKAGGVAVTVLVALGMASPSMQVTALLGAVPLLSAVVVAARFGTEIQPQRGPVPRPTDVSASSRKDGR